MSKGEFTAFNPETKLFIATVKHKVQRHCKKFVFR